MANTKREVVGPQSPYQEKILNSDAKILVIGGAAGASKSTIGLMRHLRWSLSDPNYVGYCVRKNSTAIMKEGGLFQAAQELYKKVDPGLKVKMKDQKLVFSSGASVTFTHYENDKAGDNFQGLELSNVFYDEAAQASEKHIWWLVSRLRSKAKMNPSIWLSCNPDTDSFLRKWVDWWLFPEGHPNYGLPDPEKNGKIRWVLRMGGDMLWGDSKEELIERYGNKSLPADHPKQPKPIQFQVLLGTVQDNPWILENQPEYVTNLESLPEVERQRLLLGNWNSRPQGSGFFKREWCETITTYNEADVERVVRAYDFAGTLVTDLNPDPDYTVGTKILKMKDGTYIIADVRRCRIRFGEWERFILDNAFEFDQEHKNYTVVIPQDPGVAAKNATQMLARSLINQGLIVRSMRASGSKLDRFRPFSAMAENGGVKFLKGCGFDYENKIVADSEFVLKELEAFDGARRRGQYGHDRVVVVYKQD